MQIHSRTTEILVGLALFLLILSIRIIIVLQRIKSNTNRSRSNKKTPFKIKCNRPAKTLVVLGSGGHTAEMLRLLSSITNHDNYQPLNYIIASTDTTSQNRLEALRKSAENSRTSKEKSGQTLRLHVPPHNRIFKIPRAREVGQSYFTSIFTTIYSILYTAHIVLIKNQPDILLLNGPGTCLPIALWTFIARVLGLCEGEIIFCESFCRVKSLSLTGNILWKMGIVDLFLIHWPELLEKKNGDERMVLIDSFIRHWI